MIALPNQYSNLLICSLIAGALLTLSLSPFDLLIAVPISFLLFLKILEKVSKRTVMKKFWIGFVFGFGHFLTGLYWVAYPLLIDTARFAWLVPFAVIIIPSLLSIFIGLFAVIIAIIITKNRLLTCFIFASGWILTEFVRSHILVDFPWNLIGYSSNASIYLMQIISIIGLYGTGFIIVLTSVIFYSKRPGWIISIYSLFGLCFLYGYYVIPNEINSAGSERIRIRMVQTNFGVSKDDNQDKLNSLLKIIDLSNSNGYEDIDFTIWPESSLPFITGYKNDLPSSRINRFYRKPLILFGTQNDIILSLQEMANAKGPLLIDLENWGIILRQLLKGKSTLLFGADRYGFSHSRNDYFLHNSIISLNTKGDIDYHDKKILVPFGEYIPWRNIFPFINKIVNSLFEFAPGEKTNSVITIDDHHNIIPLICFESIFDSINISSLFQNITFALNITNDLWFNDSVELHHHFTMSRMRSIEYGSSLVRVANAGTSAVIDCYGRILTVSDSDSEVVKDFDLYISNRKAVYAEYRLHNLILSVMSFIFVVSLILCGATKFFKGV